MNDGNLWNALSDLYFLLIDQVNDEAAYQQYFESHPVVFSALGFDAFESFEKSSPHTLPFDTERNYRPEPDFLCAQHEKGELTVLDLKTPFVGSIITSRSDGNRAKLKAGAESYVSQSTEYAESIRGRNEARATVQEVLGMTQIAAYRLVLIYGMSEQNNTADVARILSQRKFPTEILYYDSLLNRLLDAYYSGRRDASKRPGWCMVYHLVVPETQPFVRSYIADYGGRERDRLSVYLEGGRIFFKGIDSSGVAHSLTGKLTRSVPHYVRFEFSNDEDGIYMSLNIDNEEQDLRVGKTQLCLDPDIGELVLGADNSGANGACFQALEIYCVPTTMLAQEKLDSYRYFSEKVRSSSSCIEFQAESFMKRLPSGNMVQDVLEFRPIKRRTFGY